MNRVGNNTLQGEGLVGRRRTELRRFGESEDTVRQEEIWGRKGRCSKPRVGRRRGRWELGGGAGKRRFARLVYCAGEGRRDARKCEIEGNGVWGARSFLVQSEIWGFKRC